MSMILITGASEGIGYAFAQYYAKRKHSLILCARHEEKLRKAKDALTKMYGVEVLTVPADLSDAGEVRRLYAFCADKHVDVLVNNAGCGYTGTSWKQEIEAEEKMIDLNIKALMTLSKLFLKEMTERRSGTIINIGSTGAFQPGPYIAGYFASKSFVVNYTEAIAHEAKKYNVHVHCFCPGSTKTGFFAKGKGHCPKNAMSPEKTVEMMMQYVGGARCTILCGLATPAVH